MKSVKAITVFIVYAFASFTHAQDIKPIDVKKVMEKVADWQIAHFQELYSGYKEPHHPLDWTNGALYVGMAKWAAMANDDKYYNWLKEIGEKQEWKFCAVFLWFMNYSKV